VVYSLHEVVAVDQHHFAHAPAVVRGAVERDVLRRSHSAVPAGSRLI
jgi:hypothetical protein